MIAIAVLAADVAATLDLSDTSEVRVRSTPPLGLSAAQPNTPGTIPARGLDLVTRPGATLAATDRSWDYGLSYNAVLILPDLEAGLTPQLLQLGTARIGWRGRFLRVTVSQDGTYGVENSAYLVPTAAPTPGQPSPPQSAAAAAPITFGYERTQVLASLQLDRLTQGSAGAEYLISGGLDAASQALLPEMRGPRVTLELDRTAALSDQLVTAAYWQMADFSAGPCVAPGQPAGSVCEVSDQIGQVTEALRHKLSRSDTTSLAAGVAGTSLRLHTDQPYSTSLFPVVEGSYTKIIGKKADAGTFTVLARYAPFLDVRTGIALPTLMGEARFLDPLTPHVALRLSVGASQGFPTSDPAAALLFRGEVGADYHVSKQVDVGLGERWFWQHGQSTLGTLVTAYGLLAVTVRERTLHF